MEDFGDIQKSNDVTVFVTDGLVEDHETKNGKGFVDLHTKCLKCLETISCRASVALVVSRVTIGFRVMIWWTGVVWGSRPSAVT